jgi:squalene synthase HpnC
MAPAPTYPTGIPDQAAVLARAAGENFPVAPRLLLGPKADHLLAVYGFARLVDELGDTAAGDRPALLDWADAEVDRAVAGTATHPVFTALGRTVEACSLPADALHDLVRANRQDQVVTDYATYEDLLGYCRLSANPVGRLVLGIFGALDERRALLSDAVCTGLQIVEHCQDVYEDARAGRVYLPAEDRARFGVTAADLAVAPAPIHLRQLLAFETGRARQLLDDGAGLVRLLPGRARLAVAGFLGGGRAACAAVARAGYDVSAGAPQAPKRAVLAHAVRALA